MQFYDDSKALINPWDCCLKSKRTFQTAIITFSPKLIQSLLEQKRIEEIQEVEIKGVNGTYPLYAFVQEPDICIYQTMVGAPSTVMLIEEFGYAYDIQNFILFGSCGVLQPEIVEGHLILPNRAYRQEGTSYHYVPESECIEVPCTNQTKTIFDEIGVNYVVGATWTTDVFYRETKNHIRSFKDKGCICVEMECSAAQAVCTFRNKNFYPFFYSADHVGEKQWNQRILGVKEQDSCLICLEIALEVARRIAC